MASKTYAQVKNGTVSNVILLDDLTLIPIFQKDFDSLINIDQLVQKPGPGWKYDGSKFSEPDDQPQAFKISSGKIIEPASLDTQSRDLISQDAGAIVFNSDTKTLQYFDGDSWNDVQGTQTILKLEK